VRRIALLIALVLAGCGGENTASTDLDAGEFMQRITADHLRGDFSDTWEDLHPAHQKLISQIQFVYCGEREPKLEQDETVRILSVKSVTKKLPRIPERRVEAVRVQIRDKKGVVDTYTAHAVRVQGKWRWVLSEPFINALDKGQCPDGSPLP
jgi:hypothetical protein